MIGAGPKTLRSLRSVGVSGIALIYGTQVVLHRIGRTGDTRAIRTAFATARPVAMIAPAIFWLGVAFGLAAGIFNGYDLLAPWLVASYVLVGTLFAIGMAITVPWMNRVGALAAAAPDGPATPELSELLHSPAVTRVLYASVAIDLVIVALMVFKPGA